jgi:hypothetical protein
MAIRIEVPQGEKALTDFIVFHDQVYAYRDARWAAEVEFQLPLLTGESPFAEDRIIRPFLAREGEDIVARVVGVVDTRCFRVRNDTVGHIAMFEARPDCSEAVRLLINEVCEWLASQEMRAARAGFHPGVFDMPFAVDRYDTLPPPMLRQNPDYYHCLLKEAGFVTEKGWVDYKIKVRSDLKERWKRDLERVVAAGFEIVPMKDVPASERVRQFLEVWDTAFEAHWGFSPSTKAELDFMFEAFAPLGIMDTSVLAFREGVPVGALIVSAETSGLAKLNPGRILREEEKLNILGVGVLKEARGTGVNLAMCAYAFLELIRRGAKYLSYTLVVDDNWPSRRTAEKLGAHVCANYVTYRRDFR